MGEGKLNGISLEVRAGEILGIAGVEGNGQRELAEALIGLRPPDAGTILLAGEDIAGWSVAEIRNAGVALHPRGSPRAGARARHDALGERRPRTPGRRTSSPAAVGVLLIRKIKELARRLVKLFDVRDQEHRRRPLRTLSGGNQQKLILARELETDPKLLIAAQPTRGLDVGAIEFVWRQILEQKAAGRAVLLISAELDEIYALSDRIVTIYEGRITGEYPPDAPPEEIGLGMLGEPTRRRRADGRPARRPSRRRRPGRPRGSSACVGQVARAPRGARRSRVARRVV